MRDLWRDVVESEPLCRAFREAACEHEAEVVAAKREDQSVQTELPALNEYPHVAGEEVRNGN